MTKRTEKGLQSNTETHLKLCSSGPVGVFCFYASTHWTVFTFPLKPQIQLWVATATTQPHPTVATSALPKDLYLALTLGEHIYWWSGGEERFSRFFLAPHLYVQNLTADGKHTKSQHMQCFIPSPKWPPMLLALNCLDFLYIFIYFAPVIDCPTSDIYK